MPVQSPAEEALAIVEVLAERLPRHVDGVAAVGEMQRGGSANWRQIEWFGFWFEYAGGSALEGVLSARIPGPQFGNVVFDFQLEYTWDFKTHVTGSGTRAPLNDVAAIEQSAAAGGVGFVVLSGDAKYDHDGAFREWHVQERGGRSRYSIEREREGRPSRLLKAAVTLTRIDAIFIASIAELREAQDAGWMLPFSQGRNSNGLPRQLKYQIDLAKAPVIASRQL
jgi:hypothetical protein